MPTYIRTTLTTRASLLRHSMHNAKCQAQRSRSERLIMTTMLRTSTAVYIQIHHQVTSPPTGPVGRLFRTQYTGHSTASWHHLAKPPFQPRHGGRLERVSDRHGRILAS